MAQSTELAAGAGFTFENLIAARYLAALLTEAGAAGNDGIVIGVTLQQRPFGEPLDDVIVDFRIASGAESRLSLQSKSSLTISSAASNADFREVIRDSLKTLQNEGFREHLDRYGAAVSFIATDKFDALNTLCGLARADDSLAHFNARFAEDGNASQDVRQVRDAVAALLRQELGAEYSETLLFRFLKHFVLVRFDTLHAGGVDSAEAINAVRPALAPSANAQAPALWAILCQLAREEAAHAAQFSRAGLVARLDRAVVLGGAPSLRGDLDIIGQLAATWVRDIEEDVGGQHIARTELAEALGQALAGERFVQIRGLPGSGKSVLLRQRIEADLKKGPVLFLKSDRLEGKNWASFAQKFGLSGTSLADLLVEIGRVGSAVLYIDGIDRIEKANQGIVVDLVRAILAEPLLANWRIVISLRDAGSEPLRTWLPDLFQKDRLGTIEVGPLSDGEAKLLAEARPELQPLLFGSAQVQEIVRRPFFAKILSQALASPGGNADFVPISEVDLIENWWARGGFNVTGAEATLRQRAIIELAGKRARELSKSIALADLAPTTIAQIDGLISDGILQWMRQGHSVRFAHDIFFEWALFHRLADSAAWLDEIKAAGEPPMVGRVVELLSQADFVADRNWEETLKQIEASSLRSQWTRAWLLGPIFTPSFDQHKERYFATATKDGFRLLGKALVWFQAEKTIPNPAILDGRLGSNTLARHEIVRLADSLGWPSDIAAWQRLIVLLLDHIAEIPVSVLPDVVVVFEVWQNVLGEYRNLISMRLLEQCASWLSEIEKLRHAEWNRRQEPKPSRWRELDSDLNDLEGSLRTLVLRGARVRPDLVTAYLNELKAHPYRLDKVFKDVVLYSTFLVRGHAGLLVEISLLHFKEELPDDHARREAEERRRANERRRVAAAKPVHERTREDELVLGGLLSVLGSSFHHFAWENLAVDKDLGQYFPASPLRQPFHALFEAAPEHALRLIKDLSNHAVLAWRQLHRLDPQRTMRKPIPITLEFPWGTQEFWGNGREYIWFRGLWAPKPLAGAYQAMERWALAEVDAGRPADAVIEQIVTGHDSVAALGIAVSLMLKSQTVSAVTLPLITSQRLWRYDLPRKVQEYQTKSANQIGWRGETDRPHHDAVKALNEMPHRDAWLRDFIPAFLLGEDQGLADKARAAITAFADNLPFEYEELRGNPDVVAALAEDGRFNAEFAKPENVKTATLPDAEGTQVVYIDNPKTRESETRERLAESQRSQQVHVLWFWADKSLKADEIAADVAPDKPLAFAKTLDSRSLFTAQGKDRVQHTMLQGAVAGLAAVVLKYREQFDAQDIAWAEKILQRAAAAPEISDGLWSSSAVIPWHPGISVAKAMGYQIRAGKAATDAKTVLLRLLAHPLDGVSLEALRQCLALWDLDPRFAWCAIWEALMLCQFTVPPEEASARVYNPDYIAEKRAVHVEAAIALYARANHWPYLPAMPPAWTRIERAAMAKIPIAKIVDDEDDDQSAPRQWREPDLLFDWNFAAEVLAELPVDAILANGDSQARFLKFADDLLAWVLQKIAPPWSKKGRRERLHELGKLDGAVGHLFAKLAIGLDTGAIEQMFLAPVFALEDEVCYVLLSPFVTYYVCAAVYDRKEMPANAVAILEHCTTRVLKDRTFDSTGYRAGEMNGYDLPPIMRALLLVYATNAPRAARFANGDWSELDVMMPVIDRIVRAAGWGSAVMSDYLTLVERAQAVYPVETFADQVLSVLSGGREMLKGWRGLYLPARIAGLVQALAFRDNPMPVAVAQKLLRILDILVDMGDRRSAALQISDPFRSVRRDVARS